MAFIDTVNDVANKLEELIKASEDIALRQIPDSLWDMGLGMLGIFFGIYLIWFGIKWALGGNRGALVNEAMELLLLFGLASFLISGSGDISHQALLKSISNGFDVILKQAMDNSVSSSLKSIVNLIGTMLDKIWQTVLKVMESDFALETAVMIILNIVVLLIVGVFTVAAGAGIIATMIATQIGVYVLLAITPIIAPFLLAGQLQPVFYNWVGLVFSLGFVKIIAGVASMLALKIFELASLDISGSAQTIEGMFFWSGDKKVWMMDLPSLVSFVIVLWAINSILNASVQMASGIGGARAPISGQGQVATNAGAQFTKGSGSALGAGVSGAVAGAKAMWFPDKKG